MDKVAPNGHRSSFTRVLSTGALLLLAPFSMADTLREVVAQSLEKNPEVRFEASALQALAEEKRRARGGYLPSVDLDVSVGQAKRDFDDRGAFDRHYAELSVTQMLFDGFRVRSQVEEADQQLREQYFRLMSEAEHKALEITEAYLEVKRYRYLMGLAQANVDNHIKVRDQVRQRADRGVGNRADLYQAEGRLALAQSNLRTEVSNLQSVTARYQRLTGKAPGSVLAPVTELDQVLPAELESVMERVFTNNPAIHAAFANIQAAQSALDITKANNYPTLELGFRQGTYHNNNGFDNRTDPRSFGDESLLELRMRYNLFRGGSDRAAQRAAHHRIGQAESLRDKACVDLRQTTTIAWSELENLTTKLELLQAHRESSVQVVQAYREQFDIGRRSLLDVLDSENEAFQAERNLAQGQYDLLLMRAKVLNGMGQLLQALELAAKDSVPDVGDIQPQSHELPAQYCAAVSDALVRLD